MPDIKWKLTVHVDGKSELQVSQIQRVEGFGKIEKELPARGEDSDEPTVTLIPVYPADVEDAPQRLEFLSISANRYSPDQLRYSLEAPESEDVETHPLDAPQCFVGGALSLFDTPPGILYFSNNMEQPVTVQLLVGRSAAPESDDVDGD